MLASGSSPDTETRGREKMINFGPVDGRFGAIRALVAFCSVWTGELAAGADGAQTFVCHEKRDVDQSQFDMSYSVPKSTDAIWKITAQEAAQVTDYDTGAPTNDPNVSAVIVTKIDLRTLQITVTGLYRHKNGKNHIVGVFIHGNCHLE